MDPEKVLKNTLCEPVLGLKGTDLSQQQLLVVRGVVAPGKHLWGDLTLSPDGRACGRNIHYLTPHGEIPGLRYATKAHAVLGVVSIDQDDATKAVIRVRESGAFDPVITFEVKIASAAKAANIEKAYEETP